MWGHGWSSPFPNALSHGTPSRCLSATRGLLGATPPILQARELWARPASSGERLRCLRHGPGSVSGSYDHGSRAEPRRASRIGIGLLLDGSVEAVDWGRQRNPVPWLEHRYLRYFSYSPFRRPIPSQLSSSSVLPKIPFSFHIKLSEPLFFVKRPASTLRPPSL
ncbi:hypothetical protein VTI74DRAFT_10047 [Chaetomium olivicolor]